MSRQINLNGGPNFNRRSFLIRSSKGLGALSAASMGVTPAFAKSGYPDHPVRFIVPFAPGGGTDTTARIIFPGMAKIYGQSVVVENYPGGGTILGTRMVVRSNPDGYTMLMGSNSISTLAVLHKKLQFDPLKELAPVGSIAAQPFLLVVNPSLPVRSLKELIAYAKAHPGKVAYASAGMGSGNHLATALFAMMAGIDLLHIPYQGTGPGIVDLLAGRVQMTLTTAITLVPFVKQKKLVPIAVGDLNPLPQLPDIPPIASEVPGYEATSWNGIFIRRGTPAPIIEKINSTVRSVLAEPGVVKLLEQNGAVPTPGTTAQFEAYVDKEVKVWTEVVKRAHIVV